MGEPTPVASLTTESEQVLAMPDGGFKRVSNVRPVRTKKSGQWREIDTTLTKRSDGTVVPEVTIADVELSGGGDAPLVTMRHDDVELSLDWDTAFWGRSLPKPVLDGDTALYRDVAKGIDLEVKVTATGFRQVLIVKSAEAAKNPKLTKIRFGQRVKGAEARKKENASERGRQAAARSGKPVPSRLEVVDDTGEAVFVGNASRMWDSSGKVASKDREATVAAEGDREAVMDVDVDARSVAITPDQEFLDDPDTNFPVYIDPNYVCTTCDSRDNYLVVYQKGGSVGASSWNNDDDNLMKVGHVHDINARSYFDFNISDVPSRATINKARLSLTVNNSYWPDCRGNTYVHFTSPINSSMHWGNEPTKGWNVYEKGFVGAINANNPPSNASECTGHWSRTGATKSSAQSGVTAGIRSLRSKGKARATFGLYAGTYSSTRDWRRFKTNPGLTIKYSLPPKKPTARAAFNGTEYLGCASSLKKSWAGKGDVELRAKVANPSKPSGASYDNSSGWVRAKFAVKRNGEAGWTHHTTSYQSSGSTHRWKLSSTFLQEGYFEWRVRAEDKNGNTSAYVGSAVNESCYVMVDTTSPDTPRVASLDGLYPDADEVDGFHGGVGKTGWFTLSPGAPTGWQDSVDVDHYGWSLEPDKFDNIVPARADGTATIAITPPKEGPNTLYVKAFDKAGNPSSRVNSVEGQPDNHEVYVFNVASGGGPVASWDLDGDGADTAGEASLTLEGNASFGDGFVGQGLSLPGEEGAAAETASPVIDTSKSYSVSAWVKLNDDGTNYSVVSQDGDRRSSFKLIYASWQDRWTLSLPETDADSTTVARAISDAPPELGEWTHLVGTYDAASRGLRLYVNGQLNDEVTLGRAAWNASGPFAVGRGKWRGAAWDWFNGSIDNVRVYDRVINAEDAADLANDPAERSRYKLDEDSGTVASDSVGTNDGTMVGSSGPVNLVSNPGLESWANGAPDCFEVTGWGENSHSLTQVPGRIGQAAELQVSSFTDGRRRIGSAWADCAPVVQPGQAYDVSLWYQSDTDEVAMDVFAQAADGTWDWFATLDELWATGGWTQASGTTPVIPDGVQRIAVSLTLHGAGAVTVDNYSTILSQDGTTTEEGLGTVSWDPTGPGATFSGWGGQDMGEIGADLPGAVSSDGSFTLATFARPDGIDEMWRQAVSLSGNQHMPIALGYWPPADRWAARVTMGSDDNPTVRSIFSDQPAAENLDVDGWVHLALTYDAVRDELRFFVNGNPQSTYLSNGELSQLPEPKRVLPGPLLPDTGTLLIGRGTWPWPDGTKADPWKGTVRDVRLASGVMSPTVIAAWADGGDGGGGGDEW